MPNEFIARNGLVSLKDSTITGSLTVTGGIIGTISGTSSWATNALTASYADNFTVAGTITAQKLVVQTITSSILYSSGSNKFGSELTDTHQFTGSVSITGSSFNFKNGIGTYTLSNYELTAPSSFLVRASTGYLRIYNTATGITLGSNGYTGIGLDFRTNQAPSAILHVSGASNQPLYLIQSPAAPSALFVSGSGNVGIGTNAPADKLQVGITNNRGTFTVGSIGGVDLTGGAGGWAMGYRFRGNAGTLAGGYWVNGNDDTISYYTIGSAYNVGLTVLQSNGNVGIGTTAPTAKLHVVDTSATYVAQFKGANSTYIISGDTSLAGESGLNARNAVGQLFLGIGTTGEVGLTGTSGATALSLNLGGTTAMYVNSLRNIGIGTITPAVKLDVSGSVNISGSGTQIPFQITSGSTSLMFVSSSGNVGINTTSSIAILEAHGNEIANSTTPAFAVTLNAAKTEGISITYPSSITRFNFTGNSSYIQSGTGLNYYSNGAGTFIYSLSSLTSRTGFAFSNGSTFSPTSGATIGLSHTATFAPTSGTSTYAEFNLISTINQTGGANGITRGLYVSPTLTAAADYRAIETTLGKVIFNGGNVGIGKTTPNATLDVNGNTIITGSLTVTAGITGSITSASYALTASYALSSNGGGAAFPFSGSAVITGSLSQGNDNTAFGIFSHAEGSGSISSGSYSHAEGVFTRSTGDYSHTEGYLTTTLGIFAHAEGQQTTAYGNFSHAEGNNAFASGSQSHAEGRLTTTIGINSHAEGRSTIAIGTYSHAEGYLNTAVGNYSHIEGYFNTAGGDYSHAEGSSNISVGQYSHAEGIYTDALGDYSHAEGEATTAIGYGAHAEGYYTTAISSILSSPGLPQHVEGRYNTSDSQALLIVGNGDGTFNQRNAFQVNAYGMSNTLSTILIPSIVANANYADDTAASSGGIPVGGVYHDGGILRIRIL